VYLHLKRDCISRGQQDDRSGVIEASGQGCLPCREENGPLVPMYSVPAPGSHLVICEISIQYSVSRVNNVDLRHLGKLLSVLLPRDRGITGASEAVASLLYSQSAFSIDLPAFCQPGLDSARHWRRIGQERYFRLFEVDVFALECHPRYATLWL